MQQAGGVLRKHNLSSLAKGGRAQTASIGSQGGNINSVDWVKVMWLRPVLGRWLWYSCFWYPAWV